MKIEKLAMADQIWKEKRNHLPLLDDIRIIDREEHWRIRHLKEAVHMLGWPRIEINDIGTNNQKGLIKNCNMSFVKKNE